MLLDVFCGTSILSEWTIVWLGLPILAHSGVNPWIYAFHHGEMRVAAGKIAEDVVTFFGIHPSRYGCSPVARGGSNLELGAVNKNHEDRRPPVEDCFAAKHQNNFYPVRERRSETTSNNIEISPEGNESGKRFSQYESVVDVIEEDVHDLAKMLGAEYAVNRCHLIDTNHNVDKIKNLKYLLDPTFNKIRHLRKLNHKSMVCCGKHDGENQGKNLNQFRFISYQNLKSDINSRRTLKLNTLSDPTLNVDTPYSGSVDLGEGLHKDTLLRFNQRRDSGLASMSDPNIKAIHLVKAHSHRVVVPECHRFSVQSLDHPRCLIQSRKPDRKTSRDLNPVKTRSEIAARWRQAASKQLTVTANKLSSFFHPEHHRLSNFSEHQLTIASRSSSHLQPPQRCFDSLRHSESVGCGIEGSKLLEPKRLNGTLTVPIIHSEPPSPQVDFPPLAALREEESLDDLEAIRSPQTRRNSSKSPVRHSDPFPYVLLNIEDFDKEISPEASSHNVRSIDPDELIAALSKAPAETRLSGSNLFPEHDSTRFSSRRPSDLRWSEASRSQEILSNINEHQKSPSSYSVNNCQTCNSGSDLNDVTCLDSFMCPDALSSSLRESFFEAPSNPDSDVFTSLEDTEIKESVPDPRRWILPPVHSSVTSVNNKTINNNHNNNNINCRENGISKRPENESRQSKSSDSVMLRCRHAFLWLQMTGHRGKISLNSSKDVIMNGSKKKMRLAPLAPSTPIDICSPSVEIKGSSGIGVRV